MGFGGWGMKQKHSIPESWIYTRLGSLTTKVGSGSTPRGGETAYSLSGIPFIRSQNVNDNKLIESSLKYIDSKIHSKMNSTQVLANDLLLNITGASIGRSCVVPSNFKEGNVNQHVCIIRLKNNVDRKYIQLFLSSFAGQVSINRTQVGGNREGLNHQSVRSIKIPLPPLPEQKKIAEILSTWDEAIETTQNLISQLELRKKGLMQDLLTGKKRLPGFSGDWEEVRLGDFLEKYSENTTCSDQYPVLTSSRRGLFFQEDYYTRQVASEDNTGYNIVPRGYFTYRHMSDDLIFKFNINHLCDFGIVSTLYPVFTTNEGLLDSYLLHELNEGISFKKYALMQKQGGSRTYMYFKKLQSLKLKLPNIPEQQAIVDCVNTIQKVISSHTQKLTQLKTQKKGLMQQLLTGQKRVKVES